MTASATYRRIAADLERVPPRAVEQAARIVKTALTRSGKRATGDGRFSGAPWARLTIEVDVLRASGGDASAELRPARRAGGPWRWIEDGTDPHVIGRGRDRLGRHRRRIRTSDGSWLAGPVRHPGVRVGKRAWSRAIDESRSKALDAMRREAEAVL